MRFLKYSKIAGIMKIIVFIPERHAFFAKGVSTGMKFANTPIEEPPIMAKIKIAIPVKSIILFGTSSPTIIEI